MTDKEKLTAIKAEIERLRHDWPKVISDGEKNHLWMYFRGLNRIRDFIDSMQEEPVSEELEEASKEWLRPQLDKSYANYGEAKMMELTHFDGYAMLEAIEFGAKWQKEQFGKNRLEHCNSITNEQAELEQKFLDEHLDKNDRMPTFLDAIEYGMAKEKENIKKSPYLCGYVARDKNGNLHVFEVLPSRQDNFWWDREYRSALIENGDFPDLKWEDEPFYVRLLIVKSE